jgi:uncharacterized protein YhbP (UPF0306 family)
MELDILTDYDYISTMTLATVNRQGQPHATPVYFAALKAKVGETQVGWRLYFFSAPDSLHVRHIGKRPQVAAALYPPCHSWRKIRGLQLHGAVEVVKTGSEWDAAWVAYCAKFPFVRQLRALVARNQLYAFKPSWARLVDNQRGFGYRQEWAVGDE